MNKKRNWAGLLSIMLVIVLSPSTVFAAGYIVRDGQPMAEIVVTEEPRSSVKFAVQQLQQYIEKMSGARLPIFPPSAMGPGPENANLLNKYPPDLARKPVKIYVGESYHTHHLGVTDEGLDWGAYRMVSGDGWLALLGKDIDFMPMGIWGRHRGHMQKGALQKWEEATGDHHWRNPMGGLWNKYNRDFDMWAHDQKGTLTAVCGFLHSLGVRWYMPGELGEVVPEKKTIELPEVNKTVTPDLKIRNLSFAKYALKRAEDEMIWSMRLGANDTYGFRAYHGMAAVTRPQQNRDNHPDWYALYNDKRDVESRTPNPCLSSQELFEENVDYVRFVFDMFDLPAISVWPDDGFTAMCQCEKCKGKDTPERGRKGVLSDYVWDYVNRVAGEVYKTHPDKLIIGGAYSTYWLPPENIDEFSPNLAVHIVNARRRYNIPEDVMEERRKAVKKWARMTNNKVITFMNHGGGTNTPRLFAEDIKALEGLIMGEDMWGPYTGGRLTNPAFTHLNYYVSSRMWWDTGLDINELLAEYYENFYGPAANEMKAFIEYYEMNQQAMRGINSAPIIRKALDLFAEAENKVDPESIYGKRIAMFSKGLNSKREWYAQIKDGRENPPEYKIAKVSGDIQVDGRLDEDFWRELPGELKEIQEGGDVKYPTRFKIGIRDNNLYFGVKCMDEPGDTVNSANVEKKDDSALWYGDVVEFLLETPDRSYYQIAVNPDAVVCDLDRSRGLFFQWDAEADIVTVVNEKEGYWAIEARVPFTPSAQDPLHEIIGPVPSEDTPWFFNIFRQRIRDEGGEISAFSPTGQKTFHHILKFGKLE